MISKGLDTASKYHILEQNWLRSSVRRFDFHRDFGIFSAPQGNMRWNIVKRNAGSLNDDVRHDIVINFMLTWHKLSFLGG